MLLLLHAASSWSLKYVGSGKEARWRGGVADNKERGDVEAGEKERNKEKDRAD